MGTSIQPDIYSPQEWQDILNNARKAYHQNPQDREALAAMKDATKALNLGESAELPQTGDRSLLGTAGGIARGIADIPQSIYEAVRHPLKTAGQLTGIANIPQAANTIFNDQEANWAEKLDAAIRATPLNAGYAPERAFRDVMSNPETSSFDRARRGTNVASLALLGLGARKGPPKLSPVNAEQFGGPPVVSKPSGLPLPERAPLPETPPPTAAVETMPVGDMRLTPKRLDLRSFIGTGPESITPEALANTQIIGTETPKFTNPKPIPEAGVNAAGAPRGISVEGPPTTPLTKAMQALSKSLGHPEARVKGQKGVTFGEESPFSASTKSEIKTLLGQMQRGGKSSPNIGGEAGFVGFSVGPFLAWEIMRRTIRPIIDKITAHGLHPIDAMKAIHNNPQLAALERALVKAYAAGQTAQVHQISNELANQLMMQNQQEQ